MALEKLNVKFSNLTKIEKETFGELPNLSFLTFSSSILSTIDDEAFKGTSVQILLFEGGSAIKSLKFLQMIESVQSLYLIGMNLSKIDNVFLPGNLSFVTLRNVSNVHRLKFLPSHGLTPYSIHLIENDLSGLSKDTFKYLGELKSLSVKNCRIDSLEFLDSLKELENLNLASTKLTTVTIEQLPYSLKNLDLQNTGINTKHLNFKPGTLKID